MLIDVDIILYICGAVATISATVAIVSKVVTKTIKKVSSAEIKKAMGECHESVASKIADLNGVIEEYNPSKNQSSAHILYEEKNNRRI